MESLKNDVTKFRRNLTEQKRLNLLAKELREQRSELEEIIKKKMVRANIQEFTIDIEGVEKKFELDMQLKPQKKKRKKKSDSK